ncbi:hypothetical protein ACFW9N_34340 [Streptomyces sp. NPDC059496]|uniref:hypothetical protein n=1 Tax=Streptomyces sp. NPDC059496 TaxID=3346851 RepID=UPI0036B93401
MPVSEPRMRWDMTVKERWFCPWCYAWTEFGYDPREVLRPQYGYIRWELAESPQLPEDVGHAFDVAYAYSAEGFGATLCGIAHEGLTASPYPWKSHWPSTCEACKEAVAIIDERWPIEMRNDNRVSPAPPPGSDWPPF